MNKKGVSKTTEVRRIPHLNGPHELLELFYPIHYTVGMTIEDTLRSGKALNRHQTVIMWLIRSQGVDGKLMRRKFVEKAMMDWFEITSSSVSKALRAMSKPPLGLIQIMEDPDSGREKLIRLTPKGERFTLQMVNNGQALMRWAIDYMTPEEVDMGVHFLSLVARIFENAPRPRDESDQDRTAPSR